MSTPGSQSATVIGVIVSTLLVSTLIIGVRLYARIFVRPAYGADDTFIIITWLLVLAYNSCMLASVSYGYGQHNYYLSLARYTDVVKYEIVAQFFAVLAYVPGKISIAICLGRIFPGKHLHRFLWFIASLNSVAFGGLAILDLAQCTPAARQWNPTIPGRCVKPKIVVDCMLVGGSIGAWTDFVLAALPWYYIRSLQMSRSEKLGIGTALSLGFIAGAFAIIKTYYITTLSSRTDYAYDTVPLVLWSVGEQCAINVAASIPMLRPLIQNRPKSLSSASTSGLSGTTKYRLTSAFSLDRFKSLGSFDGASLRQSRSGKGEIRVDRSVEITSHRADPKDEMATHGTNIQIFRHE